MQSTKSSPSVVTEFVARCFAASSAILLLVVIAALRRGGLQGVELPLLSRDVYVVALFVVAWCLIPATVSYWVHVLTRLQSAWMVYLVTSVIQCSALYVYLYYLSQLPGSELASSPLILMAWLAPPLNLVYYPLFFWGKALSIPRTGVTIAGLLIVVAAYF